MKNYLIIGGSSGIGRAIFEELHNDASTNVLATYLSSDDDSLISRKDYFYLDVNAPEYDFHFLPETLDGLVYCPGRISLKPFGRIKPEEFIEDYSVQLIGAARIIQSLLPRLKKAEQSSVVLFSSVAVQKGFKFHSLVSSSKGAIEGLTKALAAEFMPDIRFNCIAPSITNTPLAAKFLDNEKKIESNARRHPLQRIGAAADIASMAVYLLSEKSSWMTGQVVHVDGGISTLNL
ncbi:SDR family NAD(P)-dependent oxidoreductase [Carboxylicivirga taeanensis]|uniref:SDR family NAD(P)-dependent oxidoreductase n=1 Tax=Carboxylicivirga taeanensis TaxID=1416875 RepID=UPI003F6DB49D